MLRSQNSFITKNNGQMIYRREKTVLEAPLSPTPKSNAFAHQISIMDSRIQASPPKKEPSPQQVTSNNISML